MTTVIKLVLVGIFHKTLYKNALSLFRDYLHCRFTRECDNNIVSTSYEYNTILRVHSIRTIRTLNLLLSKPLYQTASCSNCKVVWLFPSRNPCPNSWWIVTVIGKRRNSSISIIDVSWRRWSSGCQACSTQILPSSALRR